MAAAVLTSVPSFVRFPDEVHDQIFDCLDEKSRKSMYLVSSHFHDRRIASLYPNGFSHIFAKWMPLHQAPVLDPKTAKSYHREPFDSLNFDNVPKAIMRLPSRANLFGVVLRIQVNAAKLSEENFQLLKKELGENRLSKYVINPLSGVRELPASQM